jgi:peptidyl-prolyl cis-trans isomerase A (cyclophilin A)
MNSQLLIMKKLCLPLLLIIFTLLAGPNLFGQTVLIKTSEGDIKVKLLPKQAPLTVSNFLKYVDGKFFDDGSFFRVVRLDNQINNPVKIQVIQGGIDEKTKKSFAPIELESTQKTGIKHQNGTISMARSAPNSATSSFFICIDDQPELDYGGKRNPDGQGFAAFGKVVQGKEIVKKIQQGKTKMSDELKETQLLIEPVKIISVRRVK